MAETAQSIDDKTQITKPGNFIIDAFEGKRLKMKGIMGVIGDYAAMAQDELKQDKLQATVDAFGALHDLIKEGHIVPVGDDTITENTEYALAIRK